MTYRGYTIDGERLPSVTTVISQTLPNPGIAAWKARVGDAEAARVSKEATDWGTGIHALVESVNRGNRANLTHGEAAIIAPYATWLDANVDLVIGAEKLLVSRQYGYAGTTDAIAVMAGDRYPAILDFKTSKTALGAEEWRLQTAAYCIAAEEHLGLVCRRRIIVRLSRMEPDTLHVHELPEDELETDKTCFLALLRVWKWKQSTGEIHAPKLNSIGRIRFSGKRS